jgi:division protein CdvB (Snf7/Vps24/ESCRT-III family)
LDVETLRKDIEFSKSILENYRSYGQFVVEAIDAFTRLDELVADPTQENVSEALEIATEMNRQLGPYKSYVPQIANTIDEILKWLQEKK